MSQYPTHPPGRAGLPSRLARWFSDRATRRDQEPIDEPRIADIKSRWRQVCELSGLDRLVFTPSGQHRFAPRIGQVQQGPTTRFTVLPHPGQLLSDFEAARERIEAAMGVAKVRIRPLAAEWIVIELVDGMAEVHPPEPKIIELSPRPPTEPGPDGLTAA